LAFASDYGQAEPYVGVVKAALLHQLTPQAKALCTLLDVVHHPHALPQVAWHLSHSVPYLPAHTLLLAVADPHVGNPQQGHLLLYRPSYQQVFLAPNNGLLTGLLPQLGAEVQAYLLSEETVAHWAWPYPPHATVGPTFAGRDLYAPVAARLLNLFCANPSPNLHTLLCQAAQPVALEALPPSVLPPAAQRVAPQHVQCHVAAVDVYGNVILTLPNHWLSASTTTLHLCGTTPPLKEPTPLPLLHYYAQAATRQPLQPVPTAFALRGSHGYVELACFQAAAASALQLAPNAALEVQWC
jgi:S-adenosylmethionine hydrolase